MPDISLLYWKSSSSGKGGESGVGNGNRTRNRRSHSPVLCQLSYSHRLLDYTTASNRRPSFRQFVACKEET
jgi:hypothetical protein